MTIGNLPAPSGEDLHRLHGERRSASPRPPDHWTVAGAAEDQHRAIRGRLADRPCECVCGSGGDRQLVPAGVPHDGPHAARLVHHADRLSQAVHPVGFRSLGARVQSGCDTSESAGHVRSPDGRGRQRTLAGAVGLRADHPAVFVHVLRPGEIEGHLRDLVRVGARGSEAWTGWSGRGNGRFRPARSRREEEQAGSQNPGRSERCGVHGKDLRGCAITPMERTAGLHSARRQGNPTRTRPPVRRARVQGMIWCACLILCSKDCCDGTDAAMRCAGVGRTERLSCTIAPAAGRARFSRLPRSQHAAHDSFHLESAPNECCPCAGKRCSWAMLIDRRFNHPYYRAGYRVAGVGAKLRLPAVSWGYRVPTRTGNQ